MKGILPSMPTRLRAAVLSALAAFVLAAPVEAQAPARPARPTPKSTAPAPRPAAPAKGPAALALGAPLPVDPAVTIGTLPNGLTYYVRHNTRPAARASLRLVVKAGSIDEADDQRGLAHMLEHMAFNGGKHFKPGELVSYLESIGARFGPHVNAYTSFDETVYMLEVPTDKPGLTDKGFTALADFAHGMSLDPKEIDKERGVVIEEWRGRRGVGARVQDIQQKVLFHGSRYAERMPIGTVEILQSFRPERLRAFYEQWYRPDRMAVIVVGDIDPAEARRQIAGHFGAIAPPEDKTPRPVHAIPPHKETLVSVVADKEAQGSNVSLVIKNPAKKTKTVADYRRDLVESLVNQMFNARLMEIARRPNAPFLGAGAGQESLGRTIEAYTLSARTTDGGIDRGLEAVVEEARRADRFGFGEAELERAKKETLASYQQAYNERDKTESGSYTREYVGNFLEEEPIPGIAVEYQLAATFIPTITAAEATALGREFIHDDNRVVLAVTPEKAGLTPPTEASLRAALGAAQAATLEPWKDEMAGKELLAQKPAAGKVTARRTIDELGVTVLTLSNGAEVWLKPTDFKNDEITISAYAPGGTSLAPPEHYFEASLATSLVGQSGIGGFTPVELNKLLAGVLAGVSPSISLSTQGIAGGATPKDFETALQMLYLDFTAPNDSEQGMALLTRRLQAALANQEQSPGQVFVDKLREVNMSGHYTARSLKAADVPGLKREQMLAFYRERFANAADFTFFVVGTLDLATATPLIEHYIGALPSAGKKSAAPKQLGIAFPASIQRVEVTKGQEPKSQTVITFFADTKNDEHEGHRARTAAGILEVRLRDLLREELGGTYSVSVDVSNMAPQKGYGTIGVSFGSSPDNQEKLTAAVLDAVTTFRDEGPTAEELKKAQEQERRSLETAVKQNQYWLQSMQTVHMYGWDPRSIAHRMERIDTLTVDNVHAAARKYLPLKRYTVVALKPER